MELLYQIALTMIPGIGDVNARNLIKYCGSAEAVLRERYHRLIKIPGIGAVTAKSVVSHKVLSRAEEEILFLEKFKIRALSFNDPDYPQRLLNCNDAPIVLYYKGNGSLNRKRVLAIVGTRKVTDYGKDICRSIIQRLTSEDLLIVSGLAHGVDTIAHRASADCNISTVGVLGHGLDQIYPTINRGLAERMILNGGVLTEFVSRTMPDRENFPQRNRIIAGMADATLVIESGSTGGSLITADIALSYNRDVLAIPGRVNDEHSKGCNELIKKNKAALTESADDLFYHLGWGEQAGKRNEVQTTLFRELTADEVKIVQLLEQNGDLSIDQLEERSLFPLNKIAGLLLGLEIEGVITKLPGSIYHKVGHTVR